MKKKCDNRDSHILKLQKSNNKEIKSLENKVLQLQKENDALEKLSQLLEDPEIKTFADGKYHNEVREVTMELVC